MVCLHPTSLNTLDQGRIQDLWKGGGGAAATASAAGAKVFGGSRLKTLFGISKGGVRAPCAPPPLNPLVWIFIHFLHCADFLDPSSMRKKWSHIGSFGLPPSYIVLVL